MNFQGANGLGIEYEGYIEVNLQLPDEGFNQDILLLVVPHIDYHDFVPVTLGTLTLGLIDDYFVENQQVGTLEQEWRLVHQAILFRQSLAKDEVLGHVKVTKSFKLPAHSCMCIPGFIRTDRGGYSLHCVAESSLKATLPEGISLAGDQYLDLKQGSSRVGILLQNTTEKDITVKNRTIMCQLVLGNLVPKLLAPSSEFTDMDRHLLEECLEQEELLVENESSTPPTDNEEQISFTDFKKLAEKQTSAKASGLVTMSCTAGDTVEEPSTENDSTEDGSWLLEQIDISGASRYGEEFHQRAKDLFLKYHNTFSKNDMDLGRATSVKHHIVLTDPIPFKERYRRIPPQLYDEVRAHLQDMLRLGAIRRSCSPWASAIVLVRKKNGKLRFCIDLRKLNSKTLKDSYALPRIEQTLESLAGSRIYSTLDLTSGYWQVEMAEECKPYTAFTCGPLGFYECETMPFGATNAPATFQRLMEDCLGDLNLNWCIVYLDDVIVYSQTPEEHLERLEAVFKKLSSHGLKLKPSKCTFFKEEITYLGHLITADGVATDPSKIEVVKNWPTLETVSDVRSFLGFVGYYRRFIKGFSQIAKPLYQLTRGLESQSKKTAKKTFVKFGEKEEEAFRILKKACTTAPILAYPNYSLPFILHTDSSTDGLGAVLYQKQEEGTRVIAYASRALTAS
ncbi:MAG: RNA-directed DNA polymerase, partial [Proteobacteria bacterium]|nr:RNA-directed DNA polymerase [Pseudomonadota bacterium]